MTIVERLRRAVLGINSHVIFSSSGYAMNELRAEREWLNLSAIALIATVQ